MCWWCSLLYAMPLQRARFHHLDQVHSSSEGRRGIVRQLSDDPAWNRPMLLLLAFQWPVQIDHKEPRIKVNSILSTWGLLDGTNKLGHSFGEADFGPLSYTNLRLSSALNKPRAWTIVKKEKRFLKTASGTYLECLGKYQSYYSPSNEI